MKLPACCRTLTAKCLLLGCCAALFISEAVYADNGIVSPAPQRVAELRHLLREDCGACTTPTAAWQPAPPPRWPASRATAGRHCSMPSRQRAAVAAV
jgi:hypothetical protein